jgi:hypothetical protein
MIDRCIRVGKQAEMFCVSDKFGGSVLCSVNELSRTVSWILTVGSIEPGVDNNRSYGKGLSVISDIHGIFHV